MKGRILVTLFALPFFGVGAGMLWSIGSTVHDAWRMQDWQPVPARLASAGYETHSGDDSDTYEAYARYTYEYRGRAYAGDRVGLSGGADNIGDYQTDLGNQLRRLHARGEPVTAWVENLRHHRRLPGDHEGNAAVRFIWKGAGFGDDTVV